MIAVKRAYEPAAKTDGKRFLVDRLWPRGLKKENLHLRGLSWLRDLAPSSTLRTWFGHDPQKWTEFKRRYLAELQNSDAWHVLLDAARHEKITLLFGTRDEEHNNAVALKEFLKPA